MPDSPATARERFAVEAFVFGFTVGLVWLLEAIGWLYGGGLSSLLRASQQVAANAPLVDLDEASLRTPIMTCLVLLSWGLAHASHLQFKGRWWGAVLAVIVFGGGFVLDSIFEPIFASRMIGAHGYERCPARDHHVGKGKSTIWFTAYARSAADCASTHSQARSGAE